MASSRRNSFVLIHVLISVLAGILLCACRVVGQEGGEDMPGEMSVEIVEPADGQSIFLPCRVRVRVRRLKQGSPDASTGRQLLLLHVSGQEVTLAGADVLDSEADQEIWSENLSNVEKPGIYKLSATLRNSSGSNRDVSVSAIQSNSVHIFALPAFMAEVKISGANIDNQIFFEQIVFNFHHGCPSMIQRNVAVAPVELGPGRMAEQRLWAPVRNCLGAFVERYEHNIIAQWVMGRVREGNGEWEEALGHYEYVSRHIAAPGLLYRRIAAVHALAGREEQQGARAECMWCSEEVTSSPLTDDDADVNLYLSIIMTTRHDATDYCLNEFDHCLDRLHAALSTHLHALHEQGLGRDSEIILVEWNPCSAANAGAAFCETSQRGGRGFWSLAEAVETLVLPSFSETVVRVLTVDADLHEKVYNPTKKNIMEFIGKNVGARRARGEFILFTNPDNIFSTGLSSFLGRRHARSDTAYTTFKANVWLEIPLSAKTASPASMSNFAQRTFTRTPKQLATARHTFRRTACPSAQGLEGNPDERHDEDDEDDEPFFTAGSDDLPHLFHMAVGDFFLASREIVRTVRGYAECGVNVHVDGLIVAAAAAHGFGSMVLGDGCEVLHQKHQCHNACLPEHNERFRNPAFLEAMAKMLDMGPLANIRPEEGISSPPNQSVEDSLDLWRWNDAGWGLAQHDIPETRLWSACSASCGQL